MAGFAYPTFVNFLIKCPTIKNSPLINPIFNNSMEKMQYKSPKENLEKGEEPLHTFDLIMDGHIIGRAEITYYSKPFPLYQLSELYIEPEYQGGGRSKKIMQQVESFLKKRGRAGVLVDAIDPDSPASGMYARRGWRKVPGEIDLYAYNLPKGAKIEDLRNYSARQTDIMEREGFNKKLQDALIQDALKNNQ